MFFAVFAGLSGAYAQIRDIRRHPTERSDIARSDLPKLSAEARIDTGIRSIPKVSSELRSLAETFDTLPVFIYMREQPLRSVHNRVAVSFDERITQAEARLVALARDPKANEQELRQAQLAVDDTVVAFRRRVASDLAPLIDPLQDAMASLLEGLGARVIHRYRLFNMLSAEIPSSALAVLEQDPRIAEIAIVRQREAQLEISTPALGAPVFWEAGFTGAGETVGVLDSGVNADHPAFGGRVESHVFLDTNSDCPPEEILSPLDFEGHGTHVAGIIASQGTAQFPQRLGVARGVSTLLNLKVSCSDGRSFDDDTLRAVEAALVSVSTPLSVVNNSNGSLIDQDDEFLVQRIDQFVDTFDLVWVNSGGNRGPDLQTVTSPGIAYNAISVGSVNTNDTISRVDDLVSDFSSLGPTIGGRFKPDLVAPGEVIYSTDFASDGFVPKDGTSMAAPHIAGAAALLRQAGVRGRLLIKALLINTTDAPGWDPAYGWGYVDLGRAFQQRQNLIPQALGSEPFAFHLFRGAIPSNGVFFSTLVWNRFVFGGASS